MSIRRPANRHRAQIAIAVLLTVGSGGAAGCGEATIPSGPVPKAVTVKVSAQPTPPPAHPNGVVARIDASSDAVLAEGKVHIAARRRLGRGNPP